MAHGTVDQLVRLPLIDRLDVVEHFRDMGEEHIRVVV
jgi:hypothetical protein